MKLARKKYTFLISGATLLFAGAIAGCDDTMAGAEEDSEEAAATTAEAGEAVAEGTEEAVDDAGEAVADANLEIDAEALALDIETAILTDPVMESEATDVNVENEGTTIFLTGTVGSEQALQEAEEIANAEVMEAGGTFIVENNLQVL